MIKFSCEKAILLSGISTASITVATKSTIPVLEGLLLEADENLKISGYNLKTGIRTSVEADIHEKGSIVLNARLLIDIVRKMPDDIITVSADSNYMVRLVCGMSSFEIIGTPADDYPELPMVDLQKSLTIPEGTLKSIISETIFAVSDNEIKPIHTGSLFEVEDGYLTVVSLDGFRLALRREKLEESELTDTSFVVPGSALSEVQKIVTDSDDPVKITLGTRHILFNIGNTELISRRLEGEFLDYKKAIQIESKYSIQAERKSLIESVERVSLIINEKVKSPIRCRFEENLLKIQTISTLGKASDECKVIGDGENLEIGFNNRYVLETLKATPADTVILKLNSANNPCLILPSDGSDKFLYMILPVRIKSETDY